MIKDVIIRERLSTAMVWFNGHVGQKRTCLNHSRQAGKVVSRGELCERKISSASAFLHLLPICEDQAGRDDGTINLHCRCVCDVGIES